MFKKNLGIISKIKYLCNLFYKNMDAMQNKTPVIIVETIAIILLSVAYFIKSPKQVNVYETTTVVNVDKTAYDIVVNRIKDDEGLVLHQYICPAGHPTIGYGHLLRTNEKHIAQITIDQADSILYSDLDVSIREAYRLTGFTGNKNLAIAHFLFGFGTAKFYKSSLYSKILKYPDIKREDIESDWLQWCHYYSKKKHKWIEVPALKDAREFELDLFFGK